MTSLSQSTVSLLIWINNKFCDIYSKIRRNIKYFLSNSQSKLCMKSMSSYFFSLCQIKYSMNIIDWKSNYTKTSISEMVSCDGNHSKIWRVWHGNMENHKTLSEFWNEILFFDRGKLDLFSQIISQCLYR